MSDLRMNEYFSNISAHMIDSEKCGNVAQAEYCAMHVLMILECDVQHKNIGNIIYEPLNLNKDVIDTATNLMTQQQKIFKRKEVKTLFFALLTEICIFLILTFIAKVNVWISLVVCIILLIIEYILNRFTLKERFKKWQQDRYRKEVSSDLISYNRHWLSSEKGDNPNENI